MTELTDDDYDKFANWLEEGNLDDTATDKADAVKIKLELSSVDMQLGNNGINLKIADNQGKHLGDLRIGRGHVVWMKGKTTEANGKKITMKKFLELLEDY